MGREAFETFAEARDVFEEADTALPIPLSSLCFKGSEEELRLTEITQPAILTVSIALQRVLAARGLQPHWLAGHSLGEYSALVTAGCLGLADAVRLVHRRGRYMQEAVPEGTGAMAALLGIGDDDVRALCVQQQGEGTVEVANLNAPGQVVVAGDRAAVEGLVERAKREGARRAIMLNVSAPFHCSLMQPAADRLRRDLDATPFGDPGAEVVCNVDARPIADGSAAREALFRQVTSPVRWAESVQFLASAGVGVFVEVGPGRVLSGLVKRTLGRDAQVYTIEKPGDIDKVLTTLDGSHAGGGTI